MTFSGSEAKITFSSMNEDFVDARFDPEYKKIFQEKLEEFDALSSHKSYDITIKFFGDFDPRSQQAIQGLVHETFVNAERYDLILEHIAPEVHFFTPLGWANKKGKLNRKRLSLPASKIRWEAGRPFVELIIPEKITSSEVVIKTVRLLCSKLFGRLFFDEHVPQKNAFRHLPEEIDESSFDEDSITRFCRFLDRHSPALLQAFDGLAKQYRALGPKAREVGKKDFFRNLLLVDKKNNSRGHELIRESFREHLLWVKAAPHEFFETLSSQIFDIIPQSNLILPHEIKKFQQLRETGQWILFHALEERVQLLVNFQQELVECRAFLEAVSEDNPLDSHMASLWGKTLKERITNLKKKGLIKEFLVDNAKLTTRQQYKLSSFPLWVWQQNLLDLFPKGIPPKKIVNRIKDQYKHSIYHKLFEAAHRMLLSLRQMRESPLSLTQTVSFPRIKILYSWLELRGEGISDILASCQIASGLASYSKPHKISKKEALATYEKGWSYFVSFALIHLYYLEAAKRRKGAAERGTQFFNLIEHFILERVETQPSFRLAELMLKLYQKKDFDLQEVVSLIREDSQTLDFFVLEQAQLFEKESKPATKIIEQYSSTLQKWKVERYKHRIEPSGSKKFSL